MTDLTDKDESKTFRVTDRLGREQESYIIKELSKLAKLCGMRKWPTVGWFKGRQFVFWEWQPNRNIAQAFMVVECFDNYELGKENNSHYHCQLFSSKGVMIGHVDSDTPAEAICRAALEAIK